MEKHRIVIDLEHEDDFDALRFSGRLDFQIWNMGVEGVISWETEVQEVDEDESISGV